MLIRSSDAAARNPAGTCDTREQGVSVAVMPAKRVRIGDALAALGRKVGLTDEDIAAIDQARDKSPAKPMKFE